MGGVIAAILIAAAVSDSLGDVRAWTLVTVVAAAHHQPRTCQGWQPLHGRRRPAQQPPDARQSSCARGAPAQHLPRHAGGGDLPRDEARLGGNVMSTSIPKGEQAHGD